MLKSILQLKAWTGLASEDTKLRLLCSGSAQPDKGKQDFDQSEHGTDSESCKLKIRKVFLGLHGDQVSTTSSVNLPEVEGRF